MSTELNKLLPCPFCGARLEGEGGSDDNFYTHPKTDGCFYSEWEFPNLNFAEWNRRAAASAEQTAVPTGWKLVPVSATPEMVKAARFYDAELPTTAAACYRAMLAAAPQPPQQPSAAPATLSDDELRSIYVSDGKNPLLYARAILAAAGNSQSQDTACRWTPMNDDSGGYASACGEAWIFNDGGPAENNVRFCQGCGKPVALSKQEGGEGA